MNEISFPKEYSFCLDQNIANRTYMEDFCSIHMNYMGDNDKILLMLHDGHNGDSVAKISNERFPIIFKENLENNLFDVEKSLIESFEQLDEELNTYSEIGSTSLIVYITFEEDKLILYSANIGDTRCLLIKENLSIRLSKDHKATNKEESERVVKCGGVIYNNRLNGYLAITRSLGDFKYKNLNSGLISIPYINKIEIEKTDKFVVMGSDGIWDVITDEMAFEISSKYTSSSILSQVFVQKAINLGSRDNLSFIALKLN
jgi:serine/threonine protein phosphatase PrpC